MLAFHGKQEIKDFYISRVNAHRLADEIVKGVYWEKGKGCAVGCTLHSSKHSAYEIELGIPTILARLEDGIFECLPLNQAKLWPEKFLEAINIGSDLSEIWPKFARWLLIDEEFSVIQYAKNDDQKKSIQTIADYYLIHKEITEQQWRDAAYAAYAAYATYAADDADADDAAYAAAAYAADAAYAAAAAATYATYAAAATYATYAAYAAYAAADDADDAVENHRIVQADKLLELLKECK